LYRPLSIDERTIEDDRQQVANDDADLTEIEGVVSAVRELWSVRRGDTLVFLPTERDIRETAEALEAASLTADILPLFSRLSGADQMKVFHPDGKRARIILSTNVAETSVTVPGIQYVIDTGLARMSRYSTRTKVQRLPIEPISQASADQRKGRCGRISEGICVRLYSEKELLERPRYTDPEILRTNLASVILQMKWLRLGRIEDFPFIDPPDYRQIRDGLATLHELGAIDDKENLTEIGKRLAKLPVDPRVGRMIVGGQDEGCLAELLVIASALSVSDVRERPADMQDAADQSHAKFKDDQSDFISMLKLWRTMRREQTDLSNNQFRKWCRANFVSYMRFREWTDIHHQLCDMLQVRPWVDRSNAIRPVAQTEADPFPAVIRDKVHRALLPGLLGNVAMKVDAAGYVGARGTKLNVWPGSALFKSRPLWIMAAELVETTRLYARTIAPVKIEWIERVARHLVKRTHAEPHWVKQTAHVHAFEKVTLYGLPLVARRSVHYGPIDPYTSRQMFIHHALVENDFRTDHPSILKNRAQQAMIESWQRKLRRNDLLTDAGTRFAFFDARVPEHVYSGPAFEDWARRGRGSNSYDLEFRDIDLFRGLVPSPVRSIDEARKSITESHPDEMQLDGIKLPLQYKFDPGEEDDGVTAIVPLNALSQIPDARAEWVVPGWVTEKIEALIRSLPKKLRTLFVPVNESAQQVAQKLPPFGVGSFVDQVAGVLWKMRGQTVTRSDFQSDTIPPHLSMNFRVVGREGEVLAESRDLGGLRIKLGQQVRQAFSSLSDPRYTRDGLTLWNIGDLPEKVAVEHAGAILQGYPALIDQGDTVSLRLLDSPESSEKLMPSGLRKLFMLQTARELKNTLRDLPRLEQLRLNYRPFGTGEEMLADLTLLTADRAFFTDSSPVRTHDAFAARAGAAWRRLFEVSRALGTLLDEILTRYRDLQPILTRDYPPLLIDSIDDMRQQFRMLLPKRFLSVIPASKLEQLPRYLRGIDIRLKRLTNAGLAKDLQALGIIRPLIQQYHDQRRKHAQRGLIDPALEEYRWLLEEFRLQLFAQEIKTLVPVSEKRLEQAWEGVKRG
jgi:ATP-dependent helicase HrpA